MTRPSANLRLFVGVYPPRPRAIELVRALEPLSLPKNRATPADHVHLTLQFVGDVPASDLEDVRESVRRAASGLSGFSLTPRRLLTLPERGGARLIALETDSPAPMMELQRRLAHRLARSARNQPGDRFRPHLTLCRFDPGVRAEHFVHDVSSEAFDVHSIRLMKSLLKPTGAEHLLVEETLLDA